MNIAIDLDDVTVAIMDGLLSYHNKKYKTNFSAEDHKTWDLEKTWKCSPEEAMKRVYDFYRSKHMDNLLPMENSIDAINKLTKNHSIFFVTSRPHFLEEKTKKWLNNYFPNLNLPVYFTNQYSPDAETKEKKSDICKRLDIKLIIEDAPSNISDCVMSDIKVILYNRPWNTNIENSDLITRVYGWNDILKLLN